MRTLFAKFLAWFWVALAIFVVAEIALETTSLRSGLSLDRRERGPYDVYAGLAREAVRRGDAAALDSLRARLAADAGLQTFLVDSTGADATLPSGARVAGLGALRAAGGVVRESARGFFVGFPIGRRDGGGVAMVFHPDPRRPVPGLGESGWETLLPYDLGVRGLVVLLLGGVGSYLLARSITAPVARLRDATQRLGQGDLRARVGVTGRRDEIADLGRDFDRMATRLETLVVAQRRLIGDISHELRSPLARVNVAIALLRQRGTPDPDRMLDQLETESARLNRMIEDLLELSRSEMEDAGGVTQPVALEPLIAGIVEDARLEAGMRDRSVRVRSPIAITVSGIPGALRSAIENVVRNAIRHTAPGTEVDVTLERRVVEGAPLAVVTVRDHGPGVPEDQLERIFEPFYRVDEARDSGSGGAGLGLAIARRAVLRHGGRIVATPAHGGGLLVTIELPA